MYDIPKNFSNEGNTDESNLSESESDIEIQEIKAAKRKIFEERSCKIFVFAFLFIIFYLIGIFQLLDLFDSTKKETGIIFKSFFFDEQRRSNETFLELYINSCFKNVPEFDFAFITSIIGSFPLNFCGFFISSLLFTVLNSFLFLNFIRLDFEKQKFDFFDFFHISIYFLLFFISFGAISLFPHEKISEGILYYEEIKGYYEKNKNIIKENKDNNNNNEENKDKNNEEDKDNKNNNKENKDNNNINEDKNDNEENKEPDNYDNNGEDINDKKTNGKIKIDEENKIIIEIHSIQEVDEVQKETRKQKTRKKSKKKGNNEESEYYIFLTINVGVIFAYILDKFINYLFYEFSPELYDENFQLVFIIIYAGSYFLSLIFYFLFHYQIMVIKEMEKEEENEDEIKRKFFRICGFLIYYEKLAVDNEDKNHENEDKKEQNNKPNKIVIYNNKNENNALENGRNKKIEEIPEANKKIENSIIEGNNNVNKDINENFKINYGEIICSIIFPCYKDCKKEDKNSKYCCASCKLGCRKFYYNSLYSKYNEFKSFLQCCTCCYCKECCGCCPACQDCCCECCKKLNLKENYEEEEIFCYVFQSQRKCSWFCDLFYRNNLISLIVYNILFEIQIIGFEKKLNENLETKKIKENFKELGAYLAFFCVFIVLFAVPLFELLRENSMAGFGGFSALFYIINTVFTGFSVFGKKKLKSFTDNWLCLYPISRTKFFNFILVEKLVNILDEENIDILSNSLIITLFFFIYDVIIFLITDFAEFDSDNLILFQFIMEIVILILFIFNVNAKK